MQSPYQTMRLMIFACMGALVTFLVVLWAMASQTSVNEPALLGGAIIVSVATALAVPVVRASMLKPLPAGIDETQARRESQARFRNATFAGFAVAEAGALAGFAMAIINSSLLMYLPGMIIALLALYAWVLPRRPVIEAARERLEAQGQRSYLWEELTGAVRP